MTTARSDLERIVALEVKLEQILMIQGTQVTKIDQLLALRDKGAGAFWLASAIFGTSILGTIMLFIDWLKGLAH